MVERAFAGTLQCVRFGASSRQFVLGGLLAVICLAANRPVLDFDWVYFDDDINVVLNPYLTGGHADTWKWAWSDTTHARRYQPLGWLMFDALFAGGGLNPGFYHAFSPLLAAINAVLLFLIACRWIESRDNAGPDLAWRSLSAFLAVLVLVLHPLRANTVAWNTGLLYLAGIFFSSLGLLATLHGTKNPSFFSRIISAACFLASLLVYPTAIGLPLVVIPAATIRARYGAGYTWRQSVASTFSCYWLWLAVAFVLGVVNYLAGQATSAFPSLAGMSGYSFGERCRHAAWLLTESIARIAWPGPTSIFYGQPGESAWHIYVLGTSVILLGIAAAVWKRTRQAALGFAPAFLGALLPFIGLVDRDQQFADRYVLIALGVVSVALASVVARANRPATRVVLTVALVIGAISSLPAYRAAIALWRDTDTLQASIDLTSASHPSVRLSFARPAVYDFMLGRYASSRRRLADGLRLHGAHPELVEAIHSIESIRNASGSGAEDPRVPSYRMLHLQIAIAHAQLGHASAAAVHRAFADRYLPQPRNP